MMRITLILLLSCLTTLSTRAQQSKYLDSLERYVLNDEGKDVHIMDAGGAAHPKHWACWLLAEGLLANKQYEKALRFFRLSNDTFYGRSSWCGNDMETRYTTLLVRYADCYVGMNQIDTALALLMPYAIWSIQPEPYRQAKLKEILLLKYSKDEIRMEMEHAVKTISVEVDGEDCWGYIRLFDYKVGLGMCRKEWAQKDYGIDISPTTEATRKELMEVKLPALFAEEWYKASDGYKLLTSL